MYEEVDAEGRLHRIPRAPADPGAAPVRWDADRTYTFAALIAGIERLAGADEVAAIDDVMRESEAHHLAGRAEAPPADRAGWRRGLLLSWNHSRDLDVVLGILRGAPGSQHDQVDLVRGRHLRTRLGSASPWYRAWVASLADDEMVNVGFMNPHLCASLYNWGDDHDGIQNAMDAHRLAPHHLGNADAPVDWLERAANFVVHHLPREHYGIRHEPLADWSELEDRLANDPAIRHQPIGKAIARDAAALMQALEARGCITPWHRLDRSIADAGLGDYAFAARILAAPAPVDPAERETARRSLSQARARLDELQIRLADDADLRAGWKTFADEEG